MQSVSADFTAQLKRSHRIATLCEVYRGGVLDRTLNINSGNVTVDGSGSVRRRASVELVDEDGTLTPENAQSLLSPYGNELKLYRGLYLPDGTTELVSLGVFSFDEYDLDDSGAGVVIRLDAYDRSQRVKRARFFEETVVASGTNYATAIQDILTAGMPGITFRFATTDHLTPNLLFQPQEDRWEKAQEMAESIGMELFFDIDGVCVLQAVQPSNLIPAWEYVEGAEATFLSLSKSASREGSYNYAVVTGENTDNPTPVRGIAYDDDPYSPTYYQGPYGIVPVFQNSDFITTQEQADDAARALLLKQLGITEKVAVQAIVNPAFDIGDSVYIRREKSKVNATYRIEQFSVPMSHDQSMNIQFRTRLI